MSSKLYAHLGPYAVCKVGEVEVTVEGRWCPGCDRSPNNLASTYCPRCGSYIQRRSIQKTTPAVDVWAVREGIKEALYHALNDEVDEASGQSLVFWLPNKLIKGRRDFGCDGELVVEVTPELIQKEVSQFADDYQNAIRSLEQAYEPANVRVCWGLVQYYS